MELFRCLVIADSRGRDMTQRINYFCQQLDTKCTFEVITVPGARLDKLAYTADCHLTKTKYDLVYLFGGVNNLTEKHSSGRITPIFSEVGTLVDCITDKFTSAKVSLERHSTPVGQFFGNGITFRAIFSPIISCSAKETGIKW